MVKALSLANKYILNMYIFAAKFPVLVGFQGSNYDVIIG